MNVASLIGFAIKTSIFLMVLGLGLGTSREDALSLFRSPGLLLRSLLSMNVIMPLIAVGLATAFDLHPAVKLALIAVSVSPVPPVLPRKGLKAGGSSAYTFGLLVATCAFAIILIPLSIEIIGKASGHVMDVPSSEIAAKVLQTVFAPLALGIFVHRTAPEFATRIAKPIRLIATVLLIIGVVPVLFTSLPAIISLIGNGTLLAFAVFVLLGLLVGHFLGGPEPDHRTVLALSTASRHPGVAISIAHMSFPELKLVTAAVLLYLIVGVIVSKPYLTWWRGHQPGAVGIPPVKPRHA
jgi:BASS family bile acid:Na+ symporter